MSRTLIASLLTLALSVASLTPAGAQSDEETHDGLVPVSDTSADLAYTLPDADFSVYDSFIILEPVVAFRKNWQRDFNRQTAQRRVTDADMERIMTGMQELFLEVFTQSLEDAGYPVVEQPGANVMIIRPAIIDLDVAAPDIPGAGRSRSYVTSAGSARIFAEFFDSVSGQILARVVDYKRAPDWGTFQWATSASNRAEARRVLGTWADMFVSRLDEIHDR